MPFSSVLYSLIRNNANVLKCFLTQSIPSAKCLQFYQYSYASLVVTNWLSSSDPSLYCHETMMKRAVARSSVVLLRR